MHFDIDGLRVIRSTERGTFVEFEVVAHASRVADVLTLLLAALPDGGEVSVPEPGPHECYHECQRTKGELQIKRGCHGSYGTWRPASLEEAHDWLLAGFTLSAANSRHEQALVRIPSEYA